MMRLMDDRIRLAEWMGYVIDEWGNANHNGRCWAFLPFTDANDDYAVLEAARDQFNVNQFIEFRYALRNLRKNDASWHGSMYVWNYEIGDYARAALKIIGGE